MPELNMNTVNKTPGDSSNLPISPLRATQSASALVAMNTINSREAYVEPTAKRERARTTSPSFFRASEKTPITQATFAQKGAVHVPASGDRQSLLGISLNSPNFEGDNFTAIYKLLLDNSFHASDHFFLINDAPLRFTLALSKNKKPEECFAEAIEIGNQWVKTNLETQSPELKATVFRSSQILESNEFKEFYAIEKLVNLRNTLPRLKSYMDPLNHAARQFLIRQGIKEPTEIQLQLTKQYIEEESWIVAFLAYRHGINVIYYPGQQLKSVFKLWGCIKELLKDQELPTLGFCSIDIKTTTATTSTAKHSPTQKSFDSGLGSGSVSSSSSDSGGSPPKIRHLDQFVLGVHAALVTLNSVDPVLSTNLLRMSMERYTVIAAEQQRNGNNESPTLDSQAQESTPDQNLHRKFHTLNVNP